MAATKREGEAEAQKEKEGSGSPEFVTIGEHRRWSGRLFAIYEKELRSGD